MAKLIEYDVEGVEESSGGTGVKAKPGVYVAKIMQCAFRDKKRDGTPANDIELALSVGEEYDWVFTYIGLSDAADWKLAEFVRALNLKEKGKLDPDKQKGKLIRVKLNPGEYGGSFRPEAGRLMKAQPGDEWGSSASELSSQNGDGSGQEPPEGTGDVAASGDEPLRWREGQPDPEDPDSVVSSYDEWSDEDVLAEAEDRGLTLPGGRGNKRDKAITALRADDADDGSGDAEPAAAAEPADDAADDYDDWDLERLKSEWDARQMGDLPAIRGRGAAERLQAAIIEALRADDAENPFEG